MFTKPKPYYDENIHRFLDNNLLHRNSKGDIFRYKSELIISEGLITKGIDYVYEEPLKLGESIRYPDFTIKNDYGDEYYLEHCGLMNNKEYQRRWKQKLKLYREQDITPIDEGGNLIITYEDGTNGIDIKQIDEIIESID